MKTKSVLLFLLTVVPISVAQNYKITDLGSLGGNYSQAWGINAFGHVVGTSCIDTACSEPREFLWTRESGMQDLGGQFATGVNLWDQLAGFVGNEAVLWTKAGGLQDLGTLDCPASSGANGINLFGQITGTSPIAPCNGGGQDRAFLWTRKSGMSDLGVLPGGTFSHGNSINDPGQVVGYSDCSSCNGSHAFLWDATGGMQDYRCTSRRFF
jgi:probable HAF family extracellular repeat protein